MQLNRAWMFVRALMVYTCLWALQVLAVPASACGECHGIVILASGTAGYWPDVGTYTELLNAFGIPQRVMAPYQRLQTTKWMIDSFRSGEITEPIVLTGYSQGSGECVRLARRLQAEGIPVTSLLLLEAGGEFEIPANVRKCLNLYTSNPATDRIPLLRGLAVHAEDPSTRLINWDARRFSSENNELRKQRHLALGNSITARQILIQFIQWEFSNQVYNRRIIGEATSIAGISGPTMELSGAHWQLDSLGCSE